MNKNDYIHLLESHRDRVYSYALYCLRDPEDAEDLTQEVFLRLWHSGGDAPPDQVEAWLIKVAHNLVIDHVRRKKTRTRHLGQPDGRDLEQLPESQDSWDHPDRHMERQDQRQVILNAMTTLQEETRSIMVMHYFQGLKLQDIAAQLGKKTSTVKVQLHRARRALKLVLDAEPCPVLVSKREIG